ncbi:hypothetical protein ENC_18020 [Enterobacter hormaechei]|nr:hypothetical protein ENC_18020 [Enterobacter hormaechei]
MNLPPQETPDSLAADEKELAYQCVHLALQKKLPIRPPDAELYPFP